MYNLNIPSYSILLSKEHRIRAIQELYSYVSKLKQELDDAVRAVSNVFWIGGGQTYSDVKTTQCMVPVNKAMQFDIDVVCAEGDNIIIVMDEDIKDNFRRADINGIEIAFTITTVTISSKTYYVYTSENTYSAGTYNLDING